MLGRVSIAYLNLARIAYEAAYLAEMNHDAKSLDSDLGFFIGLFWNKFPWYEIKLAHEGLQAFLAAEAFYEEV